MARERVIERSLYRRILEVIPIPCVDMVIIHGTRFLLGKRKNKPARGKWWLIGGRVYKGELLRNAVSRKAKEEAGLRDIKIKKLIGARETMFKNSAQGPSAHTINSVFLVESRSSRHLLPNDNQNVELRWFSRVDKRWPPYVKEMIRLAGFR
ncbi:NUDIX domain-containing protein [Candidatus Parcubacteria bacterium]|nr:MAG: NUDIX domain-containing protein [Candidatus Parcubacteria bacterium]